MHLPASDLIHLLHRAMHVTLATQSQHCPGYPYATALPFGLDTGHAPLILVSLLAEHTRNVLADPRASMLVVEPDGGEVLQSTRATLVGDCVPWEPSGREIERYLHRHPQAEQYLQLGDFKWLRLRIAHARLIEGFGRMGWMAASEWEDLPCFDDQDERIASMQLRSQLAAHSGKLELIGLDALGADLLKQGKPLRLRFDEAAATPALALEQAQAKLSGLT